MAYRGVSVVVVLAFIVTLSGCFTYTPSKRSGPREGRPAEELPWPSIDSAPLEAIRAATPERIFQARMVSGKAIEEVTNEALRAMVEKPRFTVVRNEMIDGVLVRVFTREDGRFEWIDLFNGFVPNGYVLSARNVAAGPRRLAMMRAERLRRETNERWSPHGVERDPTEEETAFDSGIPFRVPLQVPEGCRGVLVHLWALAGNEYERKVAEELVRQGWFIVDVKPGITAMAEMTPEAADRILAMEDELRELAAKLPSTLPGESSGAYRKRLQESEDYRRHAAVVKQISEARNPSLSLCSPEEVPGVAAALGTRIDAALADNARAARAALETAMRMHPSLRGKPVGVIGFSAGAISTPTVAAMIKPDAVVIVGGAANAVAIASRSTLTRGGVKVMCEGKPARPEVERLLESAYLEVGRLDPYHAAPLLEGVPVLVVDAGFDTWVPSELGEVLYQRLGQPDRLHMALGGHGMLFYFLPGQARRIGFWLAEATGGIVKMAFGSERR